MAKRTSLTAQTTTTQHSGSGELLGIVGGVVAVLVALLQGETGRAVDRLLSLHEFGAEQATDLVTVFAHTVPLSVSVCLSALLFWFASHWSSLARFIASGAVLTGSTVLANAVGLGAGVSLFSVWEATRDVREFPVLLLMRYGFAYGAGLFFSSVLVGLYLAFVVIVKSESETAAQ